MIAVVVQQIYFWGYANIHPSHKKSYTHIHLYHNYIVHDASVLFEHGVHILFHVDSNNENSIQLV